MTELVFNAFVILLAVVDPLGLAPLFVGLTHGRSAGYRRDAAIRGATPGATILFPFAFVGPTLLDAPGIGVPAFGIAGGGILEIAAFLGVLLLITLASLLLAPRVMKVFGETGADVLLAALAVQFVIDGVSRASACSP